MSQRERWIIYPLLFFSFALAIRDQLPTPPKEPDFDVLNCRHLIVKDANGQAAVDIHASPGGPIVGSGRITVYGGSPQQGSAKIPAVRIFVSQVPDGDPGEQCGAVETCGALGAAVTQMISDHSRGNVYTFQPDGTQKRILLTTDAIPIPIPSPDARDRHRREETEDPRQIPPRPPMPPQSAAPLEQEVEA